jgi:hypothetical protein
VNLSDLQRRLDVLARRAPRPASARFEYMTTGEMRQRVANTFGMTVPELGALAREGGSPDLIAWLRACLGCVVRP